MMATLLVAGPPQAFADPGNGNGPPASMPPPPPESARQPVPAASEENDIRLPKAKPFRDEAEGPEKAVADLHPVDELNTASGRYFSSPQEGAHVSELFTGEANYKADDGTWQPIDPSLVPADGGYRNAANSFTTFFPERLSTESPVEMTFPEGSISSTFVGQSPASADARASTITYRSILPDTDVAFDSTYTGYTERILLGSPRAKNKIAYRLRTDGLSLAKLADGTITISHGDDAVATMPAPFAQDSAVGPAGGGVRTDDLDESLKELGHGAYELTIEVPRKWLDDPERVYPVTIDPTTVKSTDNATDFGSPLIKDTWAGSSQPTATHESSSDLQVGHVDPSESNAYMTFNIRQQIRKVGPLIYSSSLKVNNWQSNPYAAAQQVDVRRVRNHWEDNTLTWNNRPALDSTVWASHSCVGTCGNELWNIKDLMQWWVDNDDPAVDANLGTNHGLALVAGGTNPVQKMYKSKESGTPPYLETVANQMPSKATQIAPIGATPVDTATPRLMIAEPNSADMIIDKNTGDVIAVKYQLATSSDASKIIWDSGWVDYTQANSSYQVPAGKLQTGQSYFWRVVSGDRCTGNMASFTDPDPGDTTVCNDLGRGRPTTSWQSFTVFAKQRGIDHRWAMWRQGLGNGMNLSVNESNGNLVLSYPIDSLASAGEDLDVALSYNSQVSADRGMGPGWEVSAGPAARPGQMPVRIEPMLINQTDDPYGATLVYQSGRRDVFLREGSDNIYSQAGPMAGFIRRDTVKPNCSLASPQQCRGWTFSSYSGGLYRFDSSGYLISAQPSTSTPVEKGFTYSFVPAPSVGSNGAVIKSVTDPLGRTVTFTSGVTGTGTRINTITDSAGRKWTLGYGGSNGELSTVTQVAGTDVPSETVKFGYETTSSNRLTSITDGRQSALGASGASTTITYGTGGASDPVASQVKLAGTTQPWKFAYPSWSAGYSLQTEVTDPRGVATTGDGADFMTTTYFNSIGLPIRTDGPRIDNPDGTSSMPGTDMAWDTNGNLVCRRDMAANAVSNVGCVTKADSSPTNLPASDGGQTDFFYQPKRPYLLTASVGPTASPGVGVNPATAADRLVTTYDYDSGFNGLVTQFYDTADLTRARAAGEVGEALPKAETISPNVDQSWPGAPAELPGSSGENFSVRFFGQIHAEGQTPTDNAFHFRLVSQDNARLIVGSELLFDCWGAADRIDPRTNCTDPGSLGQDQIQPDNAVANLNPGWHPIAVELQALTGSASVKLQWQTPSDTSWQTVPPASFRPNLGDISTTTETNLGGGKLPSKTDYSYPSDDAKLRALPTTVTLSGDNTPPGHTVTYDYDSFGRTKSEIDKTGQAITHEYTPNPQSPNANPCESKTTDRIGLVTTRSCNAAGDVTSITQNVDPNGVYPGPDPVRVTSYHYNSLGRLDYEDHPDGGHVDYAYYPDGHLKTKSVKVDQSGAKRDFDYDYSPAGYLTKETLPVQSGSARPTIVHAPDDVGIDVKVTDERGNDWIYAYNALDERTKKTAPSGDTWKANYDAGGNKTSTTTPVTTPSPVTRTMTYDALGRLTSKRLASLAPEKWTYDVAGNVRTHQDPDQPDSAATTMAYDANGNEVSETASVKGTTEATKPNAPAGTENLRKRTWTYDNSGYLTAATSFRGDGFGANPDNFKTTYVNDAMGNLTKVVSPPVRNAQNADPTTGADVTNVTDYQYNLGGELVHVETRTQQGVAPVFWADYQHDVTGAVSKTTDAKGFATVNHYDFVGELTSVDDPRGLLLTYTYDGLGNRTRRSATQTNCGTTCTSGPDETFAYDAASHMTSAKVIGDATRDVNIFYDSSGRVCRVQVGGGTADCSTGPASNATTYGYDHGRLASRTDPGSSSTYDYQPGTGRLSSITNSVTGGSTQYTYTAAGRVDTRLDANGLTHGFTYDDAGRPVGETVTNGSYQAASFTTVYDSDSNVVRRNSVIDNSSDNGAWNYTYDSLGRLIEATDPSGAASDYAYDGASNRTKVVDHSTVAGQPPVTTTTTSYDGAARPTSSSDGTVYTHDNAGNLTGVRDQIGTGWAYDYDPWGRQTKATEVVGVGDTSVPNPIALAYTYDALDRTIAKGRTLVPPVTGTPTISPLSETYAYAGTGDELVSQATSIFNQNDTVAITTSYANDAAGAVLAQRRSVTTTPAASTTNATPSPVASAVAEVTLRFAGIGPHGDLNYLTDQNGVVKGTYTYDPWGEPRSATATEPTFLGFQSDPTDPETGEVDMGARNYLPELGRFTTQDPVAGDMANPLSMTPYVYGVDNPVSMSDPTGLSPICTRGERCGATFGKRGGNLDWTASAGQGVAAIGTGGGSTTTRSQTSTTTSLIGHPPAIGEDRAAYLDLCPATGDITRCLIQQYTYMTELGYRAYRPNPNNGLLNNLEFLGAGVLLFTAPELAAGAGAAGHSLYASAATRYGLWLVGAAASDSANLEELLRPSGNLLGDPGVSEGVRTVGSQEELRTLFDRLSQFGEPTASKYPGVGFDLPNGGFVGLRESEEYGLTIDLNIPGFEDIYKVHIAS